MILRRNRQENGMHLGLRKSLITAVILVTTFSLAQAQKLKGTTGSSAQWSSGWLTLNSATNFSKGDHLKLVVGGSANKIVVRLLAKGAAPETSAGAVGAFDVPKDHVVDVVIPDDRKDVIQISVHGGANPWGEFPLGDGNGAATIKSAELVHQ
jgi:hypothetical protein